MNDLRNDLERARAAAPQIRVELNDVYRRADRKEGRRRVGALALSLAVLVALVIGSTAVLRSLTGLLRRRVIGIGHVSMTRAIRQSKEA